MRSKVLLSLDLEGLRTSSAYRGHMHTVMNWILSQGCWQSYACTAYSCLLSIAQHAAFAEGCNRDLALL